MTTQDTARMLRAAHGSANLLIMARIELAYAEAARHAAGRMTHTPDVRTALDSIDRHANALRRFIAEQVAEDFAAGVPS